MATSSGPGGRGPGGRGGLNRYLGSTKNLVGSAGGLVGVGLHLGGLVGPWWPGAVVALYGAGALLAPSAADVRAVDELRRDVDRLVRRVADERRRLPEGTVERIEGIAADLRRALADRAALNAHPNARAVVADVLNAELPEAVDRHLSLPDWHDRADPEGHLRDRLDRIAADVRAVVEELLAGR